MVLCALLGSTGYHSASWRRADADPMANVKPKYFASMARTAERGGLDAVFLADSMAIWSNVGERPAGAIEPAVLATAIAAATENIGVIITQSTSYQEPYNVARRLTSLDHLTDGRIGWNIVTSATPEAAWNFGHSDLPDHHERYRRADEFVSVCIALWNSWLPGAVHADKSGIWADANLIRSIDHTGQYFRVRGPLDVPPSPQRIPLLVQAGSSEEGTALAAAYADWVFTVQSDIEESREFRLRMRSRAAASGADRRVLVLPGVIPVIGSTDEEARRRLDALDGLLNPALGIRQLERSLALAPDSLSADVPFDMKLAEPEDNSGNQTYYRVIKRMADAGCHTVGEVARVMSTSRGHRLLVGSASSVACQMIDWYDRGAADGYVLMPAALPDDLTLFVDEVVPILRAAGCLAENHTTMPLADRYRKRIGATP